MKLKSQEFAHIRLAFDVKNPQALKVVCCECSVRILVFHLGQYLAHARYIQIYSLEQNVEV